MRSELGKISLLFALAGCGVAPGIRAEKDGVEACAGYPAAALYVLPWVTTAAHPVVEGNCGAGTHRGSDRYAYAFGMAVGTGVTAARAGTVAVAGTDRVEITHADGTRGVYESLSASSVAAGDYVAARQAIGASGEAGFVAQPVLAFKVTQDVDGIDESMPVSFSDAGTAIQPLKQGSSYP